MEDPKLVSDGDTDDSCEYKFDFLLEYHPIMYKGTQFQGMCDLFPHVEYDAFIFKIDSMHDSFDEEDFQFESNICEHVDQNFHNEQVLENEVSFYMCYASEDVDLV